MVQVLKKCRITHNKLKTSTDQVAVLRVQFVGKVLKGGKFAGFLRHRAAVFIPLISGGRRAVLIKTSHQNVPACRGRGRNLADWHRRRNCKEKKVDKQIIMSMLIQLQLLLPP